MKRIAETKTLQIETWPMERLIPYARNARTHSPGQIAQIAASIAEFGFNNPVLRSAGPYFSLVRAYSLSLVAID